MLYLSRSKDASVKKLFQQKLKYLFNVFTKSEKVQALKCTKVRKFKKDTSTNYFHALVARPSHILL